VRDAWGCCLAGVACHGTENPSLTLAMADAATAVGASMLGSSAAKVAIFSPEALQPPGASLATAIGTFLQAVSDAVLERAARALQVGTGRQGMGFRCSRYCTHAQPLTGCILTVGWVLAAELVLCRPGCQDTTGHACGCPSGRNTWVDISQGHRHPPGGVHAQGR
jgi:hypothetical protein